jgi:signal transduction histidine kinase/DNA-binding response OmpR family regulator
LRNVLYSTDTTWNIYEKKRLTDILQYQLSGNLNNDPELQSITSLAAYFCEAPISVVTLVGQEQIDFLASSGCPFNGTCKENSFCSFAILQEGFFEVRDTYKDNRFTKNVFVDVPENPVRYYGGWPITSPEGNRFGTLCVIDVKPRKLNPKQIDALKTLGNQVMKQLILKKQNKELLAAKLNAEKLYKAKDEFLSNMSHELRTPLNAINGYAEIISKSSLNKEQNEAIEIIRNSSEILISLVNDILDYSKINSEKLKLETIPFELKKTVKLVYDLLHKKALQKNINFEMKFDKKIPTKLKGDKVRINQIIMNLAGNAIKFTEEGCVKIKVKLREETEKNVKLDFSIRDSGIGIPEDKINTIFERFEQAEINTARKFGGTGLGLNISKNLVELHGGELKVKSKLKKGSVFYFTIVYDKLTKDDESLEINLKKISDKNISDINNLNVLVCEDNSVNIKLIKHLFHNKVTSLEIAENGKMAIDILKRKTFDVILMDIHMPLMDGIETTKYIRKNMILNLPIIGFSANVSEKEREMCLKAGMNECINKSFVNHEIYETLYKVITVNKKYKEDLEEDLQENKFIKKKKSKSVTRSIQKKKSESSIILKIVENYKNKLGDFSFIKEGSCSSKNSNRSKILDSLVTTSQKSGSSKSVSYRTLNSSLERIFDNNKKVEMKKSSQMINFRPLQLDTNNKISSIDFDENNNKRIYETKNQNYIRRDQGINDENKLLNIEVINFKSSSDDDSCCDFSKLKSLIHEMKCDETNELNIKQISKESYIIENVDLKKLKEFFGDDELLENDVIESFLKTCPEDFCNLELYIKNKNLSEAKFIIHKMKSPLGMFGLTKII